MSLLLIENAKQLLTMQGEANNDIGLIENGGVLIRDGIIEAVGESGAVAAQAGEEAARGAVLKKIDAAGKIVTPGFIDCHTHVTFGGSRAQAYAVGLTDDDPETLTRRGIPTGIYASVAMTAALDKETLKAQTEKRIRNMIVNGTTTMEGKSGYGLTTDAELRMLCINRELDAALPIDIFSTFLGAHGWTEGMAKERYIELLCQEMLPRVAEEKLAVFNDVWCDEGHYTAKESETILACGERYGLRARIHTDAYSSIGGSELAADMRMLSADHLNYTPKRILPRLRDAGVTGVLLVGTDFAVGHPRKADARAMLDLGMHLGLATNCCPGCWCESLLFIIILACRQHGFSPEEALRAVTRGGARAMGLSDRGELSPGKLGDVLLMDVDGYEDIPYKYGRNPIDVVVKRGEVVAEGGALCI